MRVSEFFGIGKSQAEIDFIDVDPEKDMRLFVDPYAIEIRKDELSSEFAHHIVSFFEDVLRSLRAGDDARAIELMSNLHEPEETFLGMSRGRPKGRGVGTFNADQLLAALRNSRAFQTGLLSDLAEAELFIEGIGPDKISDLTTNIIRRPLIDYTKNQCELHDIPLQRVAVAPVWDPDNRAWQSGFQHLPLVQGAPVILVPRVLVRRKLSINSQEFYNNHVINFLRSEHINAHSGLVKLLKNGNVRVTSADLKREHPFSKEFLAEISQKNPQLLEFYKTLKGAEGAISMQGMDPDFNPSDLAQELIDRLATIPHGPQHATKYQHAIAGIMTFLFYPDLVSPVLEQPMHQGRKRVDIVYTNWATKSFFNTIKNAPQTRARYIFVECKNLGTDIKNAEMDQIIGRFSPARGRFGFITCRENKNRNDVLERARDASKAEQGVVMVLDDSDVVFMLRCIVDHQQENIYRYLERRYREIAFG